VQPPPRYQVSTLTRALDILETFTLQTPELSLSEIADRAGLPLSTATRLIVTLQERGYLERLPDSDRYRIGVRVFELGNVYLQSASLEAEARPVLQRLAQECNQTANLGIRDGCDVVHIAVLPPDRPIRFWATVGQRARLHHTGLGKVLLAGLDDDAVAALYGDQPLPALTPNTITSLEALLKHLEQVRRDGYALDDEESDIGLRCIAAPIRDHAGAVVAAVSISGPAFELDRDTVNRYIPIVIAASEEISARLGYPGRIESRLASSGDTAGHTD